MTVQVVYNRLKPNHNVLQNKSTNNIVYILKCFNKLIQRFFFISVTGESHCEYVGAFIDKIWKPYSRHCTWYYFGWSKIHLTAYSYPRRLITRPSSIILQINGTTKFNHIHWQFVVFESIDDLLGLLTWPSRICLTHFYRGLPGYFPVSRWPSPTLIRVFIIYVFFFFL